MKHMERPAGLVRIPGIFACLFFAGALALVLTGCDNPLGQPQARGRTGILSLTLGSGPEQRTIVPEIDIDTFETFDLVFESVDNADADVIRYTWTERTGTIELDYGTWNVTVTAFIGEDDVATGTGTVMIYSDETRGQNIELFPIPGGTGSFRWEIRNLDGIDSARLTVAPLDENGTSGFYEEFSPSPENGGVMSGSRDEMDSGRYSVVLDITYEDLTTSVNAILRVYRNAESVWEWDEFRPTSPFLGFVLGSWDAGAAVWRLAEEGITGEHFELLEYLGYIRGINADNFEDVVSRFDGLSAAAQTAAGQPVSYDVYRMRLLADAALIAIAYDEPIDGNDRIAQQWSIQGQIRNGHYISGANFEWRGYIGILAVTVGPYVVEIPFRSLTAYSPSGPLQHYEDREITIYITGVNLGPAGTVYFNQAGVVSPTGSAANNLPVGLGRPGGSFTINADGTGTGTITLSGRVEFTHIRYRTITVTIREQMATFVLTIDQVPHAAAFINAGAPAGTIREGVGGHNMVAVTIFGVTPDNPDNLEETYVYFSTEPTSDTSHVRVTGLPPNVGIRINPAPRILFSYDTGWGKGDLYLDANENVGPAGSHVITVSIDGHEDTFILVIKDPPGSGNFSIDFAGFPDMPEEVELNIEGPTLSILAREVRLAVFGTPVGSTVRWLHGGVPVGTGPSFDFTPAHHGNRLGPHFVTLEVEAEGRRYSKIVTVTVTM